MVLDTKTIESSELNWARFYEQKHQILKTTTSYNAEQGMI